MLIRKQVVWRAVAVVIVVTICGVPAPAALVTFDFANLPSKTPSSQVTRTLSAGSLDLNVSALGQDEDALPNPTETEAVSYVAGSGLGVRDITDLLVSDIDAVDGNRGNEELVFTFSDDVIFKDITFVDASGQNFAGEVFFLLNESEFGDFNGPGNRIAFFNAFGGGGAGNPQWQGLPNYTFPANQQGPKSVIKVFVQDANSGVFVSSLTVEAIIPEPAAVVLLGIVGAALQLCGRRRAR